MKAFVRTRAVIYRGAIFRAAIRLHAIRPLAVGVLGTALMLSTIGFAREGVEVGGNSAFAKLVPAEDVERSSAQQYLQMLQQANAKKALAPRDNPQLQRLRNIAAKIIPFAVEWNPRARDWKWEVNLIGSNQINAYCMPGGKIAFYTGILDQLKLTDDEVAMVMGHEVAHALREHARERMGKNAATHIGANVLSQVFGFGQVGQTLTNYGAQLLTLGGRTADQGHGQAQQGQQLHQQEQVHQHREAAQGLGAEPVRQQPEQAEVQHGHGQAQAHG